MIRKIETSPCIDLLADEKARADFLVNDYSKFILEKNSFKEFFSHAKKKLGNQIVRNWEESHKKVMV